MLKNNGHFLILFMAWLPFESEIAKASEDLVLNHNPAWTGGRMKRYTIGTPGWLNGLFTVENAITYALPVTFTRESWHGRMKACRGIGASSLSIEDIAKCEDEHKMLLMSYTETFDIPHFVSILNLKKEVQNENA